jgi:hypothetical protein
MANLKLADVRHGASLMKKLIAKSDLNLDGAIRGSDLTRLAEHGVEMEMRYALEGVANFAKSKGGPSVPNMAKAVDEFSRRAKALDLDGSKALSPTELKRTKSDGERRFLDFCVWAKSKDVTDFDLPKASSHKPKFKWTGTPAEVCTSLLRAHSSSGNDNQWPHWGSGPNPGSSRYVIDGKEAEEMVKALKPLYLSRQRAVLSELAGRTEASTFGCVSPTNAGKGVLLAYAAELGLDIELHQPAAPAIPN